MKPKCLITLELPDDIRAPLEQRYEVLTWPGPERLSEQVLGELLSATEGLLCALSKPISASLLNSAKALKVVSTISVGVDHIDLAAATRKGIAVGHTPGVLVDSTADLALALMLGVTRRVAEADRWIRGANWTQGWQSDLLLGTDLSQAKVGVVGLGPIGEAVARLGLALGMNVTGFRRTPQGTEPCKALPMSSLAECLPGFDAVVVAVPLTDATNNLFDASAFSCFKPGAFFVNVARGGVVEEEALIAALESGQVGGAGLDVFREEPLGPESPLWMLPNVLITPHSAGTNPGNHIRASRLFIENLGRYARGEALCNEVGLAGVR